MFETIKEKLTEIEELNNVRVLYACESGSRAWGFPSPDSDYDVRFIYAARQEDYLTILDRPEVIDLPVNELLDIGGWDIRKALKLFLKSNGPLFEWLQSPIVYRGDTVFVSELRSLMPEYFSLRAGGHHYLSMAINTVNNDLQNNEAKLKRYFYALRSTLACKWIAEKRSVPPMELAHLRKLEQNDAFQQMTDELLDLKKCSDEKTLIRRRPALDDWLQLTLQQCKAAIDSIPAKRNKPDELNQIFRKYIA